MSAGLLFEWAAGRGPAPVKSWAPTVDPQIPGPFAVEGREHPCVLHLSVDRGFWSVDVRDRSGAQLQGFDGMSLVRVLREARDAGVRFDEDDARRIGLSLGDRGTLA